MREFVSLARVAGDAGADDIFPGGLSPSVARQDMIDIEMAAIENSGAVLASVFVALKDIVARELDLFFRQAVKEAEDDDLRNPDPQGNGLKHPRLGMGNGKILPTQKIMREEIAGSVIRHNLCVSLIEEGESPSGRAGIDGLPQPVEDKYRLIEQIIHDRVVGE
jgi:hypothetical protein